MTKYSLLGSEFLPSFCLHNLLALILDEKLTKDDKMTGQRKFVVFLQKEGYKFVEEKRERKLCCVHSLTGSIDGEGNKISNTISRRNRTKPLVE